MGAAIEQNLAGGSSFDTIAAKAYEILEKFWALKQQAQPERKMKPGAKGKAETKPLISMGGMTMSQIAVETQREERVRL